ncbi:MAG: biotin/lipoyl-containing protein [Motiliproteus sp.]
MSQIIEIKLSQFPECWETCGTCAGDDIEVAEVLVGIGDRVALYETLAVLELVKTDWEITADQAGQIVDVLVTQGDTVTEGEVLMLLKTES